MMVDAADGDGTHEEASAHEDGEPPPVLPAPRLGGGASGGRRPGPGPDLTRYLCAHTYLRTKYANRLIRRIAADPHLGVAPAPACDVPVVLRHAYRANSRRHHRDLVLSVLLLFVVALLVTGKYRLTGLPLFLVWVTVVCYELSTRYRVLKRFRADTFRPEQAPAPPTRRIRQRLDDIGAYAEGNMTTYSGRSPFLGFGAEVESWFLTFSTTVRGDGAAGRTSLPTPQHVDVTELYATVAEHLVGRLSGLPGLRIEERLFVEGSFPQENRHLLSSRGRPLPGVTSDVMDDLKRRPQREARPYLAVHCTDWGGELVVSFFLRFVQTGGMLTAEAAQWVLPPLADRYRTVDWMVLRPTPRFLASVILNMPFTALFQLLAAPVRAVAGLDPDFPVSWRLRRRPRRVADLGRFDHGAGESVRPQPKDGEAKKGEIPSHFQLMDALRMLKSIERTVLDSVVLFAEDHGMDTRDLVAQQALIVNNGIIATGRSRVESNSVASGARARARAAVRRGKSAGAAAGGRSN